MTELSPQLMRLWARWCAREVVHLWEPPEVVLAWLDTGAEDIRAVAAAEGAEASDAACYAASEAASEPHAAYTAYSAAYGVCDSPVHADSVGVYNAAHATAHAAVNAIYLDAFHVPGILGKAKKEQCEARALIRALSSSLTGLSSLRLDVAHDDPWLTREVWRTLELPDMQFVEDWYIWTQDQWD